jgi:uncharacterized membrane protein
MKTFLKYLRSKFISGLFATVPIIATIFALKFLLKAIDGLVGSLPERLLAIIFLELAYWLPLLSF